MKNSLTKYSAVLLASFALAACDGSPAVITDNSATDGIDGTDGADGTDGSSETDGIESAAYVGKWATGCISNPFTDVLNGTYFTYDLEFDTTTWELVKSGYLDEGCTIQEQGTPDIDLSVRGTTTIAGSYTDQGTVATADGLQANNLSMTVDSLINSLEEPDDQPNSIVGATADALVYVDDANVLFLDDYLLGINEEQGTLVLTLPFDAVQSVE